MTKRSGRPDARLRNKVGARDGWICWRCHQPIDPNLSGNHPLGPTLEHKTEIVYDGQSNEQNCTVSHRHCNSRAGARLGGQRVHMKRRPWINPAW